MAGFYPDVPDNRMAYHLDGTKIYIKHPDNTLTDITGNAAALNDEDGDAGYTNGYIYGYELVFVFPELRDIRGYFWANTNSITPRAIKVSTDTTNLLDGTWTSIVDPFSYSAAVYPNYRKNVNLANAGNVKALSFTFDFPANARSIVAVHLYGFIPPAESPQRLIFWDPTLNQQVSGAHFDWGDVVQGTSYTKTFRINNNSPTLTANSVGLSAGAETYAMSVEFSADGTTYTPTIDIGNLAPSATSGILHVRRNVPAAEPLRAQVCRFRAAAGSWT